MVTAQDPFDIARLPSILHEKLFKLIGYNDMLTFASLKPTNFDIVRSVGRLIKPTKIDIRISPTVRRITVSGGDRKPFVWSSHHTRSTCDARPEVRDMTDVEFNGRTMKVCRVAEGFATVSDEFVDEMLFMLDTLWTIYRCPVDEIEYTPRWNIDHMALILSPWFRSPRRFGMGNVSVYPEELDHFFDGMRAERFELGAVPSRSYRTRAPIAFPEIVIAHSRWLTAENLCQMVDDSRRVTLRNVTFTSVTINAALKRWMAGTSRLEVLKLWREPADFTMAEYDGSEIVRDIEVMEGSVKARGSVEYFDEDVKYEEGVDVRRDDGLVATLVIDAANVRNQIVFTVWHDPACLQAPV